MMAGVANTAPFDKRGRAIHGRAPEVEKKTCGRNDFEWRSGGDTFHCRLAL
jgi:hypothetical protein